MRARRAADFVFLHQGLDAVPMGDGGLTSIATHATTTSRAGEYQHGSSPTAEERDRERRRS